VHLTFTFTLLKLHSFFMFLPDLTLVLCDWRFLLPDRADSYTAAMIHQHGGRKKMSGAVMQ
jgi:hypothetical protein